MNHFSWTYVGDAGFSAKVGLYHSSQSGHLMIYVGSKIMVIDFKVRESKDYSFFINDELVRIKLERRGDQMYYSFEIDKEADTPRNRARQIIEKKYLRQTFLFFGIFFFAVALLAFFLLKNDLSPQKKADLLANAKQTVAQVALDTSQKQTTINYFFVAQNKSITGNIIPATANAVQGMPLESGDEFLVDYAPNNPKINQLRLDLPTTKQLDKYRNKAFKKHSQLHQDLNEKQIDCLLQIAYEIKGIRGLADFYFQNTPATVNATHNENTYLRLIRDIPFKKRVDEICWE